MKQKCKRCGKVSSTIDGYCLDCWLEIQKEFQAALEAAYKSENEKEEAENNFSGVYNAEKGRISLGSGAFRKFIRTKCE